MSLDPSPELARSVALRFWSKVDTSGEGCWTWGAGRNSEGYGHFWVPNPVRSQRMVTAHRVAFILVSGQPIAAGLHLDHLCHNADELCAGGTACPHRLCVRPDHLEAVPTQVNTLRGAGITAQNLRKTHCLRGHVFDIFRTERNGRQRRDCSKCRRRPRASTIVDLAVSV